MIFNLIEKCQKLSRFKYELNTVKNERLIMDNNCKTISPTLTEFLNYMSTIKGSSPLTVKEYKYDLNIFLRFIKLHKHGELINDENLSKINFESSDISLLETLSLQDLYSYLSFLDKVKDNSSRTRARKISSLKTFFDYLVNKTGQIESDPTAKLDTPKSPKSQPVYLTLSESVDLLSAIALEKNDFIRTRDYAIVSLFLNLGLRLSELQGININDIKDENLKVTGKGNKERTVHLNNSCIHALNAYMVHKPKLKDEKALFLSTRNKRISIRAIQARIEKYIENIGLDSSIYSVHKLRHTAATLMHKYGGTDIRTLQSILGHESVATTQIYTHVDDQTMETALDNNPLNDLNPTE